MFHKKDAPHVNSLGLICKSQSWCSMLSLSCLTFCVHSCLQCTQHTAHPDPGGLLFSLSKFWQVHVVSETLCLSTLSLYILALLVLLVVVAIIIVFSYYYPLIIIIIQPQVEQNMEF